MNARVQSARTTAVSGSGSSTASVGRLTHGNLARPSGTYSASVPIMTTASIGHQGAAKRDTRRAKSWRHVTSEEARPGVTLLGFPDPYHRGERRRSPGRVPSSGALCPYPTICRLWVACPSVGGQVARRLPGRHSSVTASPLRCRTGLSVGRRGMGRPPPWCPQGGLLPAGTRWTLWQTGGDCNAIAGA